MLDRRFTTLTFISTALLAAACDDDLAALDDATLRANPGCATCNVGNSPRVNDYEFPELHLDSLPNEDGVVLRGILNPANVLYKLDVVNDDFVARTNQGVAVASGPSLIGWRIVLDLPNATQRHVKINGFNPEIPSWATNAAPISGYNLTYQVGTDTINVCPGMPIDDVAVTLILGETYDRDAKTVNPDMTRWFTIACRDEATYKMKRMNYGPNDHFNGGVPPATPAQRQATIKMITADYCGTGVAYTAQGTTVYWKNASNTVNNNAALSAIEARWTADGATCLSTPRYVDRSLVACAASLPACTNQTNPVEWTTSLPSKLNLF